MQELNEAITEVLNVFYDDHALFYEVFFIMQVKTVKSNRNNDSKHEWVADSYSFITFWIDTSTNHRKSVLISK